MKIKYAVSNKEKSELDHLLWLVLWEPLGFPRDIRESFALKSPEIDLIAVDAGTVVGGIVANWLSRNKVEIRHVAVKAGYQGISIGKRLVEELVRRIQKDSPIRIQTYARNTSAGFFTKLGFKPTGEYLEHKDFATHGIKFQEMRLEVK